MRRQRLSLLFVVAGLFGGTALAQTPALSAGAQDDPAAKTAVPSESPFPDDYDVIEAPKWRTVKLEMELSHGGRCEITLARPLAWLELVRGKVGETIDLQMPEMGVAGPARVVAIEPCPEFSPPKAGSRPVIGKFVTTNAKVIDLSIDGLDKPIGTTASHPFWSLDRKGWVAAGDLKSGEKLRTQDGSATVESVIPRAGTETVYNIEVHKNHTFFVSDAKLWVHNACIVFGRNANQAYHTFRKVDAAGLDRAAVQSAIEADLLPKVGQIVGGQPFNQVINVGGRSLRYTAYLVDDWVNVGRIDVLP